MTEATFPAGKLGFGMMRLPLCDADDLKSIDWQAVNAMVDEYLSAGFSYFDTAYPYHGGMSERVAKESLALRHPRSAFVLADKSPTWEMREEGDYRRIFEEQLDRCGVDHFDYYMLHNLGQGNYDAIVQRLDGFGFIEEMKRAGKIGFIGFSFHDRAELLERILTDHPETEFVQLQINYADWEDEGVQARLCYEAARRHGVPIIVMEPVKGGSLASPAPEAEEILRTVRPEWSPASWALRFAASLEGVAMVLSGMGDRAQVRENLATFAAPNPFGAEELRAIDDVREALRGTIAVPCTACGYCLDDCPQGIPISRYLALYNNQAQYGMRPSQQVYYGNLAQGRGRASECIACGACTEHCPQHIDIPRWMDEVAAVFEA